VHKVDAPDMIGMLWPEADDRAVPVIETSALLVPLWKLQPFFTPETFHLLVIDPPAFDAEEFRYLAPYGDCVAIT